MVPTIGATITDGLVAYYPLNGNANDASGNGNNGTESNVSYVTDRFGTANSAAALAGNSGSLIALDTLNLNLNPSFTASAWVKIDGAVSGRVLSTAGYELSFTSGGAAINVTDVGNAGASYESPQMLSFGVWHQVVGVWSAGGGEVYTDGVLAGSYTTSLNPDYSRGFIPKIGRNSGSSADSFPGGVDEVRVYSRGFSAQEVAELYQYESTVHTPDGGDTLAMATFGLAGLGFWSRRRRVKF